MIQRSHPVWVVLAMVASLLPVAVFTAVVQPAATAASTGSITMTVKSARSVGAAAGLVHEGDPVTTYKWIVNEDDTGDPGTAAHPGTENCWPARAGAGSSSNPDFADTCPWPSIRSTSGFAPIVAQGNQDDLAAGHALDGLAPGKYLISVTASGFKIGGQHFTVPTTGGTQAVDVRLDPTPLPLSTLRIQVFNDNIPVDSTYEVGAEQPLAGFTAHLTDVFGDVSVDYYGNALCTIYKHANADGTGPMLFDADNRPIIDTSVSTGRCTSNAQGEIVIPNMGPDRYAATVTPPANDQNWVQTTTLEGGRDHDMWFQEGETGYDNEVTKGAELVPMVQFGFVRPKALAVPATNAPTGEIKGLVVAGLPYIGGNPGGLAVENGFPNTLNGGPINKPWVALNDLSGGDAAMYVGRGETNGTFDIKNVPDGTYQLTLWDDDLDYILYSFNVEVADGGITDVGTKAIVGWFTHIHGHVFIDSNENGKRDPGEASVPQFPLTVRERDNSLMDQAVNTTSTNANGAYDIREVYPLGKWTVLEAFDTRYRTTGISYKGENETSWTTRLGGLVDLDFLPIIGLGGEIDWGVQPYQGAENGGIVGTVTYDTTRNELDPADAATEGYQPGIPGIDVRLYASVPCQATTDADKANECRQGKEIVPLQVPDPNNAGAMIDNPSADRGSLVKGPELSDAYTSEKWDAPRGCTAYDFNGDPLTDQRALPDFGSDANHLCLESPMMGVAINPSDTTPGNAGQTVNGNYGFATSKLNLYAPGNPKNPAPNHDFPLYGNLADAGYPEQDLGAGDYIVAVDIPDNPVGGGKMYKATSEGDVNVFTGDGYLPQENMSSITPAEQADPPGPPAPDPTPPSQPPSQQAGIISPCAGPLHKVDVTEDSNPDFLAGGGSPFQGQDRPSCDAKLVTVRAGQATAPNFNLFTDVPIPTHFWGLTLNDLGLSYDKRSIQYGEAQPLPFVPMGLYDWAGRLVDTVHTDSNGYYEALEPSTSTYNCPVPAGPCPNMYRFVGNDPGQPGHLNSDYNPRFRTIAATFQGWPGLYTVTDTAPTQVANTIIDPGTTNANPAQCDLGDGFPQLFSVSRPYVRQNTTGDTRQVVVKGVHFGGSAGTLRLGSTVVPTTSWTDSQIGFTVPASLSGPQAISITRSDGATGYNTVTIQVLARAFGANSATNPAVFEVGPGKQYATVQAAINAARPTLLRRYSLVVVWPNAQTSANPRGEYTENLLVGHRMRIQGVGPGGFTASGDYVPGSVIDGLGFNPDNAQGAAWLTLLTSLRYTGDPQVPDGAVVTFLHDPLELGLYDPALDGFTITGGVQQNFPANVNTLPGAVSTPYGATGALVTQGGGVYVHDRVQNLQLTDNVIVGNGGSYGGGIRVGTPYLSSSNTGLTIARNQIRDNGGTNLAGGVGIFAGSGGYRVTNNAICGNFSAEYGGGVSAYGYQGSTGGRIDHNRIWFNGSYDEGGGVMVAGELPSSPTALSQGSGPVSIDHNQVSTNIANDDGGGIRLLQASGSHITQTQRETISIVDNDVVNNVSAHEGGGIALDDAVFVDIVGNTIARNVTTATAVTTDGMPAPAGLSTATNSDPLQARLRNGTFFTQNRSQVLANTTFSKPTLLDNVFWDNRAGTFTDGTVTGIGVRPDGTDGGVENWDMGMTDTPLGLLSPRGSVIQTTRGTDVSTGAPNTNRITDAVSVKDPFDLTVDVLASRTYPAFRQSTIVAQVLPPNLLGDYHLTGTGSPAYGAGLASLLVVWGSSSNPSQRLQYTVSAPTDDREGDPRGTRYDAGADQVRP
ncbi:hypothetical protein EFL26_06255 [Nocardioides pocheonensis]|uniref:Alpha-amylase n=1 Tax=Nocardioides pocheonensis TaxID=661485 RepID=A0A3N0GTR4_9ACTN|nr:hypothetical protein EFL26_06255 [Nocardioides pocheonensis]